MELPRPRRGTHWRARLAAALRLPMFVVHDSGVAGGVFDIKGDVVTVVADIDDALGRNQTSTSLQQWLIELVR